MPRQESLLRFAFLVGAVTDAAALVPLLVPEVAQLLWGFTDFPDSYGFASGYAAALMLGWTGLLVWAFKRPLERRFVAPLTIVVIYGLLATEVAAVVGGAVAASAIAPTCVLQLLLLALFAGAFHQPTLRRLGRV